MGRLADLAELVRAPAALSVPGDLVSGASAAGVLGPATGGLTGASVCLYWAGMAANDWADRDLDAVERPERPIPSGRVRPAAALGIAAGLTAAGVALAAASGGRRSLAVAVPLAAMIWAYDLRAKNTAAGPAVMAACRTLDVLLGATASGPAPRPLSRALPVGATASGPQSRPLGRSLARALPVAAAIGAHTYTVTALSRREVSGARPALPAATLAATGALAAAIVAGPVPHPAVVGALAGQYLTGYGVAQGRAVASPGAGTVRAAVGAGITSLPALQGALTARAGSTLAGLVVAAAAPLARMLARKVSPT
ncbi:SCO3242 family prenyltransferase [Catenuloplanes sp. NPDC051500]|uniref:SCO3242 family prenyltransferase n=1 Tax=Catenuloplanes sp. NPDC051500 TaxID=3363959 RepID=UPI0037937B78